MEYELLDTGIFNDDRYFDVFVEYAKDSPEEVLIKITLCNRGASAATIHVLPTLWFRNTWSWSEGATRPSLKQVSGLKGAGIIAASDKALGDRFLYCEGGPQLLFTENETNSERLFQTQNRTPYVKDGINNSVVHGRTEAVNPEKIGTKAAAHYQIEVGGGETAVIRLRLSETAPALLPKAANEPFGKRFDDTFATRLREADEFYQAITPPSVGEDARNVMRQALSGMLWTKQYFYYDVDQWLREHGSDTRGRRQVSEHSQPAVVAHGQ